MTLLEVLKWIHLLAVAVWTGGLITLAALVPVMRRAGADRPMLQAVARRFGVLSWAALALAVATGVWQVAELDIEWSDPTLDLKIALVVAVTGLAVVHTLTARRTTPTTRGAIQGMILLLSVVIFGVAVSL